MKITRLACCTALAGISGILGEAQALASGDELSLPESGVLLILGAALMAFAFYRRIRNK